MVRANQTKTSQFTSRFAKKRCSPDFGVFSLEKQGAFMKIGKNKTYACNPPERNSRESFGLSISRGWQKMWRNFGKFFADLRPSISRENGRAQNFTQIPARMRTSNSAVLEPKFFHCETLGVERPPIKASSEHESFIQARVAQQGPFLWDMF